MSEWPMVKLGEVADFINGAAFKPSDWSSEGRPIIRIQNLTNPNSPFNRTERKVKDLLYVDPGDLLVSWSATLGVFRWTGQERAVLNQHIFKVVPKSIDNVYLEFGLRFALQQIEKYLHGATMRHINRKEFLNLTVPLPPLGEQKRIAEILGNIQNAIELTSLQLDDISSSMKIESWTLTRDSPQTQLSHYIKKITSGKSLKEGNWENFQNCILKISAVTTGFFDDSEIKPLPESYTPQASHKVNTGDILLSRANTTELVGASAIVENAANNLYLPDKLWKLHIKDDVDTYFFWHLLQTKPVRSSISKASSGSGGSMKNISQKSFLNITVPKISREVQNQIGKNIRLQHILRSLLIKKLNLLQELQRSLSVRAFAGEL
ncbi:restriction endonuclease subunit S [Corynebacterium durum]|jgi:type I restriction-modification system, S subunit, putative|uniref:Type I restriction modification DNA specificity domain protein n=1 Tax=Corynebacterium durum F0235 TaxID=1035195 RepID=L1MCP1_9CORY|nr:restriction endonuclease subunit S [Corynebacterium durum]EKX89018.1 type I restriction modification DNA specificity domain protein [Corynebacterium durum F0235]